MMDEEGGEDTAATQPPKKRSRDVRDRVKARER